jgi:hypothetical protein
VADRLAGRRGRFLLEAHRRLRADGDRLRLVLGPALLTHAGPRADDHDGRGGRADRAAQVRPERAGGALPIPRARRAPARDARLPLRGARAPGGRHRRRAGARVPGCGRPVPRARAPHRRGHPDHAAMLGGARGDVRGRVLAPRSNHGVAASSPAADAAVDRRQQRGRDAAGRSPGRRLDSVVHHARAVSHRRRQDADLRGRGGPRGARGPLRVPDPAAARALALPFIPRGRADAPTLEACTAFGPPELVAERLEQYVRGGGSKFVLRPMCPPERMLDQLAELAAEVVPAFHAR